MFSIFDFYLKVDVIEADKKYRQGEGNDVQ